VNINLTLVIQMVVFALLIWVTMKFIWPMVLDPMEARSKKIALGLAAAEKGQLDLANAEARAEGVIREARELTARRRMKASAWWTPPGSRSTWPPRGRARTCARKSVAWP
jgi:F0F1-type ATP synthase membrane subunit b/b'